MLLLRCTKKLQKEIGLKKADIQEPEPVIFSEFGSWHVNLVFIDRKKCIVFVNDLTLFNFIIPDLSREQIRRLSSFFIEHLQFALAHSGIPLNIQAKVIAEYKNIPLQYANTNNKSVLGSMNDIIYHYKFGILDAGGIAKCDISSIVYRLNHMPLSAIKYNYSSEILEAWYFDE